MSQAARACSTTAPAFGRPSSTTVNRRSLLAGALVALAVPAAADAATAAPAAGDPLDALWRERTDLVAKSHELAAERAAAVATMPEWARPGPAYVDSAGRACGETVPWPRRLDATLPAAGSLRLARASRQTIEQDYQHDRRADPAAAEHFRARRLAAFEDRLVAQRLEEDRAGVTRVQREIEADWLVMLDIETEIAAGPVTFNAVAALLLIDISYDAGRGNSIETPDAGLSAAPLRFIRGQLSGEVAIDVAAMLDGPTEAVLSSLRFRAA
jgi:hypothetical protein